MLLLTAALLALAAPLGAHETDQLTVPTGQEFADLGRFVSYASYRAVREATDNVNEKIYRAAKRGKWDEVRRLQSPDVIAARVRKAYGPAYNQIEDLEKIVHSDRMVRRFPGKILGYKPTKWIYFYAHHVIDPRRINMSLWRASTIRVFDTYLGTDKLGHFHDMGYIYYQNYRKALARGATEREAMDRAVRIGTHGAISERGILGEISSGIYSNADLAANYMGMKFYQNLTAPVPLNGEMHPPMLVPDGPYWSMNPDVFKDTRFFRAFVSDHFDEALNPNQYSGRIKKGVEDAMRVRCRDLYDWYALHHDRPRDPEHYRQLARELSTYYGEDYGHARDFENLITIGSVCE